MYNIFKFAKNKIIVFSKLLSYGFVLKGGKYYYSTSLKSSGFTFTVVINDRGEFSSIVYDNIVKEEYVLHLVDDVEGTFAINVREECEQVVQDIINCCAVQQVFQFLQTKRVEDYILRKYGVELEFPWDDLDAAIWRHLENKKWFGIVMKVDKSKLGYSDSGIVEVINLKALPQTVSEIVNGKEYLTCYHMNKKHWFSVVLDGRLADLDLFSRIDDSFNLTKKK